MSRLSVTLQICTLHIKLNYTGSNECRGTKPLFIILLRETKNCLFENVLKLETERKRDREGKRQKKRENGREREKRRYDRSLNIYLRRQI